MITAMDTHTHDVVNNLFDAVLAKLQVAAADKLTLGPVFRTDAKHLFELYLNGFKQQAGLDWQHYNCSACHKFISDFGSLVVLTEQGDQVPLMWDLLDLGVYTPGIEALYRAVEAAKITSPFFTNQDVLGTPRTGNWTHFALSVPERIIFEDRLETPGQHMAPMRERYRVVRAALANIKLNTLEEALYVLKAGAVQRSETYVGSVQWLIDLHHLPKGRHGSNRFWRMVTLAPEGYCHPRAGVIATLLEDIETGMSFDVIQRRFNAKLNPLQFQRPQVDPSAGTIKQAEAIFAKLGLEKSLERRFARLDELKTGWIPTSDPIPEVKGGVFAHLTPKSEDTPISLSLPTKTMTWEKFTAEVLPTTKRLQMLIPNYGSFTGILTAVHSDAKPILMWDKADDRYPISYYIYHRGSSAYQWGLSVGAWVEIDAIAPIPRVVESIDDGDFLVLRGAKDICVDQGNALFPNFLISELHKVRSVIEAYSKTATLSGREEASANGYLFSKGPIGVTLKAFDGKYWNQYYIDRTE